MGRCAALKNTNTATLFRCAVWCEGGRKGRRGIESDEEEDKDEGKGRRGAEKDEEVDKEEGKGIGEGGTSRGRK